MFYQSLGSKRNTLVWYFVCAKKMHLWNIYLVCAKKLVLAKVIMGSYWQSSLWEVANNNFPFQIWSPPLPVAGPTMMPAPADDAENPNNKVLSFPGCSKFNLFSSLGPFLERERWCVPLWDTKRRARPSEYIQVLGFDRSQADSFSFQGIQCPVKQSRTGWETSFKTSLPRRTTSWQWSCLGRRRLWWRRGWGRRRLVTG